MKTPIDSTTHSLRFLTMWLTALLLLVVPARAQTTSVGGTARPFTVTNLKTGQPIQMSDFAGKVLVLDFFAYWCGPCQSSSPDLETNIQKYYATLGGNANGVPVQCLAVSIDDSNPTLTNAFIQNAGLELAAEDPLTTEGAWQQFNETGGIPLFVIINCVESSPSHGQWEVMYKKTGYAGAPALRAIIDQVMPGGLPAEIAVDTQDGRSLADNGPAIDMGNASAGSVGEEQTFTIRNTGEARLNDIAVTMDGANAGDFTLNTSRTLASLNGGSATTFKVTFAPKASGFRNAVLHIASSDSDESPFDIILQGTSGNEPEMEVRSGLKLHLPGSAEVSFGYTIIGQTGEPRTLVISNIGTAPLTGVSVSIRGKHPKDFEVVSAPDPSILPGASSSVILRFAPSSTGPLDASLHITSNDADENPFDILLTGRGTESNQPPGPEISLTQGSGSSKNLTHRTSMRHLGASQIGKRGKVMTFKVTNTGTSDLKKLKARFIGKDEKEFVLVKNLTKKSLAPGMTATFKIAVMPRKSGTRKTTLQVLSNDKDENPFVVQLTGQGQTR